MGNIWSKSLLIIFIFIPSIYGLGRMVEDKKNDPVYSNFIGTKLVTKQELVIYKGDGLAKFGVSKYGDNVPEKKDIKHDFPYWHYDYKILGILSDNSVFRITDVKREGSSTANFIYIYGTLISSNNTKLVGKKFHLTWLTNGNEPPTFLPELVDVLPKE